MGACCTREQTQMNELVNSVNYSTDEIINDSKIDSLMTSELRLETVNNMKSNEEKELDLIIKNIQSIYEERVKTISQIDLYNLAIYYKDNYTQSNYLLYDTRKSSDQKEDYLKKMNHINYTFNQIKNIKNEKLKNFKNFLDNKKIIFIISEKYLHNENKKGKTTPLEIINTFFSINNNISIYILNNILNDKDIPKIFIKLISFLGDKSSSILPYILFSYRHVTSFYIDGYIFLNFEKNISFSFNSLVNDLNSEEKILNFNNNFLKNMHIHFIINIDNNSKNEYKVKEDKYKNKLYKTINISKRSIYQNKNDIIKTCNLIRDEISHKGYSIYINIEDYNEQNNEWIFVIIVFLSYIIQINYIEIAHYLRQKINFIKNISQIINNCLTNNSFDDIFNI